MIENTDMENYKKTSWLEFFNDYKKTKWLNRQIWKITNTSWAEFLKDKNDCINRYGTPQKSFSTLAWILLVQKVLTYKNLLSLIFDFLLNGFVHAIKGTSLPSSIEFLSVRQIWQFYHSVKAKGLIVY